MPTALARVLAHALALTPMLWLAHDAFLGQLGADPVAELSQRSGDWTLRLLLLTLAVTPLRRFTGWRWPGNYRRMLGLHTFAYACLHFSVYLVLDLGGYWAQILDDIVKRPFITVGFLAWL
ncbi:MAG: sulfoxide reductase heme-binding subunit YedZ, partial [Lysobacterales bacterium CG_4_10_14_3_um_filter_64_11]